MLTHICRMLAGSLVLLTLSLNGYALEAKTKSEKIHAVSSDNRFAEEFKAAPSGYGLYVRWQWPGPNVKKEEIYRQVKALADEGFGGAELTIFAGGTDWNTDEWNQAVQWALEAAREYGITIDFMLTVGTISIPNMAIDADAAEKRITFFQSEVAVPAGSDGKSLKVALGYPTASKVNVTGRLIGLSYAEAIKTEDNTIYLDEDSVGVLYENNDNKRFTSKARHSLEELLGVRDMEELKAYNKDTGKFTIKDINEAMMTVNIDLPANPGPADKKYYLFSYWEVPSGKTFGFSEGQDVGNTTIDHLSKAGAQAVVNTHESSFDKFPKMRELLKEVGGAWFGDSLEINKQGEWTRDMLNEFYARNGYDILPYLVAVASSRQGGMGFPGGMGGPGGMDAQGGMGPESASPGAQPGGDPQMPFTPGSGPFSQSSGPSFVFESCQDQVLNTYYDTVTDLFINNHLATLSAWAAKYDMTIRYQSTYGYNAYMAKASLFIDIPETESLHYSDHIDGYRGQAGAVHMASGSGIYSQEVGETREQWLYMATWNDFLWRANRFFVAGGNQNVYHVFPYSANSMDEAEVWPGFKAQPNVGDNLSTNFPSFGYVKNINAYFSRAQNLLRQGKAKVDIGLYYHSWANNNNNLNGFYKDDSLDMLGYSYDFIDPSFLAFKNAKVNQGVLNKEGPGYKALVFNNQKDLPLETAQILVKMAGDGLPMIFIGDMPESVSYFTGSRKGMEADSKDVKTLSERLKTFKNVARVKAMADVPEALKRLGISPDASYDKNTIITVHRRDKGTDYYFLYNQEKYYGDDYWTPPASVKTGVSFHSEGSDCRPYYLNLWTGEISPVAEYTINAEGRILVDISLQGNEACAIAIAEEGRFTDIKSGKIHVEKGSSDNNFYRYGDDGAIILRATKDGSYNTVLSDGKTTTSRISGIPDPVNLENWRLKLTSWAPGETSTDVIKEVVFEGYIGKAVSWNTLGKLANGQDAKEISGIGIYTTIIDWDKTAADGAYLDIKGVRDLYRLYINDKEVYGADIVNARLDIGKYLSDGRNTIRVEAASNVYNAMNANDLIGVGAPGGGVKNSPAAWTPTEFGLTAGATLIYYKDRVVSNEKGSVRGFTDDFKNIYDDPDTDSKAWTRYWVSASYYTEERVDYEMKSMADAGIGVVELQQSYYFMDTEYHKNVWLWLLRAAKKYGLKLDIAGGTSYPSSMPSTSRYYKKENMVHKLVYGSATVKPGETYNGAIPLPKAESSGGFGFGGGQGAPPQGGMSEGTRGTGGQGEMPIGQANAQQGEMPGSMPGGQAGGAPGGGFPPGGGGSSASAPVGSAIAVVAVHVIGEDTYSTGAGFMGGSGTTKYYKIDQSIDLTSKADLKSGTINWTAPASADGHWEVLGFWKVLSSSNTIDYLSRAASEAYCRYWDKEVLYNDEVRELFKDAGRNFWEDSLESITINWTDELIEKFEKNRGYKFPREMMPTLLVDGLYSMRGGVNAPSTYEMEGDLDRRFRNDFFETLSDLYNDNHLTAIQDFFKENYGMGFKCQIAYNYPLDVTSATMAIDYPEYEGLDSNDVTDSYRVFAGAMHTSGKKTFSSENCARMLNFSTDIYRVKFRDWLWHVNVSYSGGNNASVYHGVESAYDGTQWPGKAAIGPGFAETFGPRMPYWQYMDETVNSYLARSQKVLQTGRPKMDLAIFFNWFDYGLFAGDKGWVYYTDRGLEGAGYSYDFISTASLSQKDALVKNTTLFGDGPAYKALILNANRPYNTVLATKGSGMIPVAAAEKILELARDGLPVIVIGDPPSKTLNYGTYQDGKGDIEVRAAMAELLKLKNVVQVKTEADAVEGLARLGVYPDAQFKNKTLNLSSFHRADTDADFYFLFNRTHAFILSDEPYAASNLNTDEAEILETDISFKGDGVPYLLDPWTGDITPITEYKKDKDRVIIHVKLDASDTRVITIAKKGWSDKGAKDSIHVAFSDKIDLTNWTLQIESWEPNDAYKAGDNGKDNANVYEIVKKLTDIDRDGKADTYTLKGLKPWNEIDPDLKAVSGVGYYKTTISLPKDWNKDKTGYTLDLGATCELFQAYVNDKRVDFNQIYPSADITEYLQPGNNTIRVEVASTIFNAAKTWNKGILDSGDRKGYWESYGLLGPVELVPYGIAELK